MLVLRSALACESNIYRLIDMQASYNRDPNNKKRKESQNLRVAILVVDKINQMKREHKLLMQHLHDAEKKLAALQEAKEALDSTHTGRLDGDISAMAEKVDTLKKQVDDVKGCIDNFTDIDFYSPDNYAMAMPLLVNKLQAQHATNNATFQKNFAQVSHKSLSATAANDPKARELVVKLNKPVKGASGKTSTVLDVIKADVAERINTMKGAQTVEDVLQKHGVVPQPKPKRVLCD